MDFKLTLLSIILIVVGILIMKRHKFYLYPTNDMLFATTLKVFSSGLLFFLMGVYGIVNEILKLF